MLAGTLDGFLGSIEPKLLPSLAATLVALEIEIHHESPSSHTQSYTQKNAENQELWLFFDCILLRWRTVPFFGLIFWQKSPVRHTILKPSLLATLFNSYPLPLLHQFTHWLHISSWLGCPTWWISAAQVAPTAPQMIGGHDACSTRVVVLPCPVDHMANPAWNLRCQGSRP